MAVRVRAFVFLCTLAQAIAGVTERNNTVLPIPQDLELCNVNGITYVGLKPHPDSNDVQLPPDVTEACELFFHCKAIAGIFVVAERFRCADADPAKPYYDASTCKCVEDRNHCSTNTDDSIKYNCVRSWTQADPAETCRGFERNAGEYYEDIFPNLDDPTKFWSCAPLDNTTTYALPMDCSCAPSPDLIFDASKCRCSYQSANMEEIQNYNKHPMNRFKCAKLYNNELELEDICQDPSGRFYVGLFPNPKDRHTYWQCIEQSPSTSEPILQKCEDDLVFDMESCNCSSPIQIQHGFGKPPKGELRLFNRRSSLTASKYCFVAEFADKMAGMFKFDCQFLKNQEPVNGRFNFRVENC